MTGLPPRRLWRIVSVMMLALAVPAGPVRAADKARQVTICGIVAVPNSTAMDPKLAKIAPQLRKLLPNHGFKLLDVKSRRLYAGQAVTCNLSANGYTADAILVNPLDSNGKVRIRCELLLNNIVQLESDVTTPPNQLFFCDQALADGSHLLLGVGAR